MTMKDIGATIKAIRSERGVAASDFAGAVGMSQEEIDRLESGEEGFRSATLIKIAYVLNIPPFRLFMTDSEWTTWKKTDAAGESGAMPRRPAISSSRPTGPLPDPSGAPEDEQPGPSLFEDLLSLAGKAKGLPQDLARNHDHYIHGTPKR